MSVCRTSDPILKQIPLYAMVSSALRTLINAAVAVASDLCSFVYAGIFTVIGNTPREWAFAAAVFALFVGALLFEVAVAVFALGGASSAILLRFTARRNALAGQLTAKNAQLRQKERDLYGDPEPEIDFENKDGESIKEDGSKEANKHAVVANAMDGAAAPTAAAPEAALARLPETSLKRRSLKVQPSLNSHQWRPRLASVTESEFGELAATTTRTGSQPVPPDQHEDRSAPRARRSVAGRPRASALSALTAGQAVSLPPGCTTLVLHHVPKVFTHTRLEDRLQACGYDLDVDLIYLPAGAKDHGNVGIAFLNFRTELACTRFAAEFHLSSRDRLFGGRFGKVCEVSAARVQGFKNMQRCVVASSVFAHAVAPAAA